MMSTTLFEAAKEGDTAKALSLLDKGADVNTKDKVKIAPKINIAILSES
jgi:ankyrin repeat protein